MTTILNPYLNFDGNAREAMEFYSSVFGGDVNVMTFGDMGEEGDLKDKVMHSQLETPQGFTLMASDPAPGQQVTVGNNYGVSLSGDDEATLRGWYDGLVAGGDETLPIAQAPWGDHYGQFTDKFGVAWMFNIAGTPPAG